MTDFQAIKQAVSMAEVLEHYALTASLRRSGDGLRGPCPIHRGRNPTQFRVSLTANCWVCFGDCNGGGSILDFVSRMEQVSLPVAAGLIEQWFSGCMSHCQATAPVRRPSPEPRLNLPLRFRLSGLDSAHPYLVCRGLLPETIQTFGMGYCTRGLMAGRVAIPIHNAAGRLVAYAGRWPGEPSQGKPKYLFPRGFRKSLELFNYHRLVPAESKGDVIVVEGFLDCLKVWQAGCHRVVAIMGSSLSDYQAASLVTVVAESGEVVLMLDEDAAGRAGSEKARRLLTPRVPVRLIRFEKEGTQPDQLSADELRSLIAG